MGAIKFVPGIGGRAPLFVPNGQALLLALLLCACKLIFLPLHTERVGKQQCLPIGHKKWGFAANASLSDQNNNTVYKHWNPFLQKDITLLENVQHCTTRLITSFGSKSHEKRLSLMQMTSSETGTKGYVIIQIFQIFKKMIMFMVIFGFQCLLHA